MQVVVRRKDIQLYASETADLGSASLSLTTTFAKPFKVNQITFNFDTNSSNVINVYKDSGIGSNYDTLLHTKTMNGSESDYVWRPTGEVVFTDKAGTGDGNQDEVLVSIAASGSCNVYIVVQCEEL